MNKNEESGNSNFQKKFRNKYSGFLYLIIVRNIQRNEIPIICLINYNYLCFFLPNIIFLIFLFSHFSLVPIARTILPRRKWNRTARIWNQKFHCRSLNLFQIIVRIYVYGIISKNDIAAYKAEKPRTQIQIFVVWLNKYSQTDGWLYLSP